ncbi:hypothetical protein [Breoghania sp.]|uniref:hypothetical protein n=1 Tax=Breoghania sp. TaxID=2065378 RepID=UPI002AA61D6F|nr:hypothetical protein [Breoghania sp.]
MGGNWTKRLMWLVILATGLGAAGLIAVDVMLTTPPITRTTLETMPMGKPQMLTTLMPDEPDTICLVPPHEKRVPQDARDAAAINGYLISRTYGGDATHWALVVMIGNRFALTRFERSEKLDIAWGDDVSGLNLPEGFAPEICAEGHAAALLKTGEAGKARVVFGAVQ